jgi:hypothetical protein
MVAHLDARLDGLCELKHRSWRCAVRLAERKQHARRGLYYTAG